MSDGRSPELFARVPFRVHAALRRGDLTLAGFAIVAFLAEEDFSDGEAVYTLRALIDALQWPWSADTLWRELRRLRSGGWIEFESKPGQRRPYVFRLTAAARVADASRPPQDLRADLRTEGPSGAEVDLRTTADPNGRKAAPGQGLTSAPTSALARAREEETKKKTDRPSGYIDVPDALAAALRRLGAELHPAQLADAAAAWDANPELVERLVAESAGGSAPAGLFASKLRDARGCGLLVPREERERRRLEQWLVEAARPSADEDWVRCTLEDNFRLDAERVEAALARWRELRAEAPC